MCIRDRSRTALPERAASQEHFIDLCRLLGQATPAEQDATGKEYTFEKGVAVTDAASRGSKGRHGFADVWWRGKFAWEYKRKDKYKDLSEAYRQLCQYREALENPPLLIVSDIARTEIHTNFTGTRKEVHVIKLEQLAHPDNLDKLRRVFSDPHSFKPTLSTYRLTENAAAEFAKIADALRQRGHDPHDGAHFLMKCMFCLFAEDVSLLPKGLFSKLVQAARSDPESLTERLSGLFEAMRTGGFFGAETIAHFNGGLFDEAPALPLKAYDMHNMLIAGEFDWAAVEPTIFGTLFERSLDPSKRSQIGAHYTSREDIMLIVEPVVMQPLRREWAQVRERVEKQLARRGKSRTDAAKKKTNRRIAELLQGFQHRLASVRVLDPACGSGNFLYVAIQELLSLEKEVIVYGSRPEIALGLIPQVRPTQLHGIEINPFAAELAQVVIWIGYLQWMKQNGFLPPSDPILAPLVTIECRDAILDLTIPTKPQATTWPEADFIIGNPPFLGSKLFRQYGLPDEYIKGMYECYDLPNTSDLCCYWFELARQSIAKRGKTRAGLLATQGIRGGDNRRVLARIKETGDIFMAWSDREWILDGAAVHVSMVGFDTGLERNRGLDGATVQEIHAGLTGDVDTASAMVLRENVELSFIGGMKKGKFEIEWQAAREMLAKPSNPNDRPNSDVIRPWVNGLDVVRRSRGVWIVDFGSELDWKRAALYEAPFEFVKQAVKPARDKVRATFERERWWLHARPVPDLRDHLERLDRYVATARLTKHRLFVYMSPRTLPDGQLVVFARSDDYFFGVVHSSIHELWALRMGTQLEDRPRYTPTTCFETFPLPWAPRSEPIGHPAYQCIADAARELNEQRERWLNPPEWIKAVTNYVEGQDDFGDVPEDARGLIRQSAIMAEAGRDSRLKKRTLTNLYNERPTWLRLAHEKLDRAVLAAYAATDPEGEWSEEWAEVWTESGAGQPLADEHPLGERRKQIDQQVLGNLLRLNLARAEESEES